MATAAGLLPTGVPATVLAAQLSPPHHGETRSQCLSQQGPLGHGLGFCSAGQAPELQHLLGMATRCVSCV